MRYRLLLLDAGFTLLAPRRTLADALSGVLAEDGHTVTRDELHAAWEVADRWFWDEYHRPGNDTWTDDGRIDAYWRRYHARMLDELGLEPRREMLDRILTSQFRADAWELYDDVLPMLRHVRDAEPAITIGVVSDWGSNLHEILTDLELDPWLDFVLASGAVGLAKPDPAFFRVALDRADAAPGEALMVGDSYRADVHGARSAGVDALWLDRTDGPSLRALGGHVPGDVRCIGSLAEVPSLLGIGIGIGSGSEERVPRGAGP